MCVVILRVNEIERVFFFSFLRFLLRLRILWSAIRGVEKSLLFLLRRGRRAGTGRLALLVRGLKDGRGRHQVLDVLAEDLIFRAQLQVLLLDALDPLRQIVQRVLQLQHLRDEPGAFLLLVRIRTLAALEEVPRAGVAVGVRAGDRVQRAPVLHVLGAVVVVDDYCLGREILIRFHL